MSKQLSDATARQRITTDLATTFLVEAGAGSGKTTNLVQRMVSLVRTGTCRIEHLAAITFTRKAAAELKSRFQIKLEKALREATDPTEHERLAYTLDNLHLAFLGTIHSFCSRLLRERPVEAGMTPDFDEIEGLDERLLQERAWQEYLQILRLENPKQLHDLADLDVRPEDLKASYLELCLYPDVTMVGEVAPYPDLNEVREELYGLIDFAAPLIPADEPEKGWDPLQAMLRKCRRWQRAFDLSEDKYLLRLLAQLDKKGSVTQNRWITKEGAKAAEQAFTDFREQHLQPALQEWREHRHYPLLAFLLPATEHYASLRQQEHKLNFQDLLMRTAALLRHNSEVRQYFGARFTHLLVDEFQDTDPIQAEIMMLLTAEESTPTEWSRTTPRPGSLFVVGDPKQSIYRFRRADITTYNQVKEQIRNTGGEVLHLTSNFRSVPSILHTANSAFNSIFALHSNDYQADFKPIDPARDTGSGEEGIRLIEMPPVPYHSGVAIAELDASAIAAYIRHSLDGSITLARTPDERDEGLTPQPVPGDFLILVRYKKDMALYARALEEYHIPFSLSGGSDITTSYELAELLLLLQALADPTDSLSLVAVLRGSFFGLSDAAFHQHKQAGGIFSFYSEVPPHPSAELLAQAFTTLKTFRQYIQDLTASSAIERIMRELGLIPLAFSGELAKGKGGYLLQALELIRMQEQDGTTSINAIVDFLAELLDVGVEDELDLEGLRSPGVRIMNLHKAKGLEAPVVFLANPGHVVHRGPSLHISRNDNIVPLGVQLPEPNALPLSLREAAAETASALSYGKSAYGFMCITRHREPFGSEIIAQPPHWHTYAEEESHYLSAEENRLLYVAATRAKNLLLVSIYPKKPDKSPWQSLEPFLTEVKTLENISASIPEPVAPTQSLTPAMLDAALIDIALSLSIISLPTYTELTVTDLGKQGKAPTREATGRGASWGNAVHNCLELLARGCQDIASAIPSILTAEGRDPAEQTELIELLTRVQSTPIWQRAMAATTRYTEVPFGTQSGSVYLTGVIDLAFQEPDGWVLLDYKSDHIIDDTHLRELTTYYTPQIQTYAQHFTQLTGETIKECGLLFTERQQYIRL